MSQSNAIFETGRVFTKGILVFACVWGGWRCEFVGNRTPAADRALSLSSEVGRQQESEVRHFTHADKIALEALEYRGIELSPKAMREWLQRLQADHPAQLERRDQARQWVKELGSPDYPTRRRAIVALGKAMWLPMDELAQAQESDDLELRSAAQMIIRQSQKRAPRDTQAGITEAICHLIVAREIKGLCLEVAAAAALFEEEAETLEAIRAAIVVTASPQDIGLLKQLVDSPVADLRISALQAILALQVSDTAGLLNRFLSDPDPRARLFAAHSMANLGERQCVTSLLELMAAQDFDIRHESHRVLKAFTHEDFEYHPFGLAEERHAALARWQQWWDEFGSAAKLDFPLGEMPAGNGKILLSNFRGKQVLELSMDGEVTWQVDFESPWAIKGLPNGHRLISQLRGHTVVEFDKRGQEVWRHKDLPGRISSFDQDGNGNLLTACPDMSKIYEFDRIGKLIWDMDADGMPTQVNYLKNGNRLLAIVRTSKILEIDPNGKRVLEISEQGDPLSVCRTLQGTTIVVYSGSNEFVEFDQSGRQLRKVEGGGGNLVFADQAPDGDFIIATNKRVSRINPSGKVVWEYEPGFEFHKISVY